jgi:uncharacterized protein
VKVVIDTNILLVSFSTKSKSHWLWESFKNRKFKICVSTEILNEYAEIFEQKYNYNVAESALEIILESPNRILITEYFHWNLITVDPDDNKFVDCAFMANADYIVTNDKHFNDLKNYPFPPIKVISLDEFYKILTI